MWDLLVVRLPQKFNHLTKRLINIQRGKYRKKLKNTADSAHFSLFHVPDFKLKR